MIDRLQEDELVPVTILGNVVEVLNQGSSVGAKAVVDLPRSRVWAHILRHLKGATEAQHEMARVFVTRFTNSWQGECVSILTEVSDNDKMKCYPVIRTLSVLSHSHPTGSSSPPAHTTTQSGFGMRRQVLLLASRFVNIATRYTPSLSRRMARALSLAILEGVSSFGMY